MADLDNEIAKSASVATVRGRIAALEDKVRALERIPAISSAVTRGGTRAASVGGPTQSRSAVRVSRRAAPKEDDDFDTLLVD